MRKFEQVVVELTGTEIVVLQAAAAASKIHAIKFVHDVLGITLIQAKLLIEDVQDLWASQYSDSETVQIPLR